MRHRVALVLGLTALALVPSVARAQSAAAAPGPLLQSVVVEGPATLRQLRATHGAEGLRAILHLNRVDLAHVRDGSRLVVPAAPATMAALAPFPTVLGDGPWRTTRLVVVSRRIQAFAAYENGALVRWGAVSTGRQETPTPAGLFATNWKSKLRRSSDNAEWLLPWYVNLVNATGVSFHQFALPGHPASHACVRLLDDDARWIYDWVDSWVLDARGREVQVHGTPVVVFGDYAFDQPAPWTRVVEAPDAATVSAEELDAALAPHRGTIEARAAARAAWLAAKPPQ